MIKESIKYFTKLSAIAVFSWIKINVLATISTLLVAFVSFYFILEGVDAGHSGHAGFFGVLLIMFISKPLSSILFLLILASPPFIFALGNKYIISKLINKVITDKSEGYVEPFIDKILNKFQEKQPDLIRNSADASIVKLKLINQVKLEADNKWLKRIIAYSIKKIRLDDVDFSDENVSFTTIIKGKVITALHDMSEPSRKSVLLILGLQWLCLLIIVFSPI